MFDIGVMLTICATGGMDVVSEEDIVKLTTYSNKCCIIHALDAPNINDPGFDFDLISTLLSLKRVFQRISP